MPDNEKIRELSAKITDGVKKTFEGDNFKKYLNSVSLFHDYSMRNTMLVLMQRENVTHVAGYQSWKKLNRFVKRGEKGISIIAPTTVTVKKEKSIYDDYGNEKFTAAGNPVTEQVKETCINFTVAHVYDISQTDGEPLPEICRELQGDVDNYEKIFNALKSISPYKVVFERIENDTKGYCSFENKKIALNLGMSEEQIIKTLIHEFAHAVLHKASDKSQEQKEIEAESVAYIVSDFLGLETSGYSFDYIADWSRDMQLGELQQILDNIQSSANEIIHLLQEEMKSLEKVQDQLIGETENLQNRLKQAAEKSIELKNEKGLDLFEKSHIQ